MKYILWYLLAGTRGGMTRVNLLRSLEEKPKNAHQLAKSLKLDYKTIQHHLKILEKNNLLHIVKKGSYGDVYFLAPEIEPFLKEIWEKIGR
ncbi:winged helix-turn-helix transcriptional regulator [Candidatus Woesearchaeota archaeon]|nr:winged helix-turn-helix transcriptional regulator [Candidatus Woesearchaeota archaeon]